MSGASEVDFLVEQFNRAMAASESDRKEASRMRDLFTGFGKGHYSAEAKSRLSQRGSIMPQINLSRGKIKRLAGSLVKNFFDISFIPVASEANDMTRLLNDAFVADSNTFDYSKAYLKCVVDALIHQGVEQMSVSTRFNPLGNINFEYCMPGHILVDPGWKTDDSWDITEVFKVAYLTPKQIVDIYGYRNPRIKELLDTEKLNGFQYDEDQENPSTPHLSLIDKYGSKFRVVERHYLETETRVVKFARVGDETVDLPDDEDQARDMLARNGLQDKIGDVISRRVQERVYHVDSACREIEPMKLLDGGKSDCQIGRLPFFPLSAERYGGTNSGIMALLEDIQKMLNGREAQIDDIIASHSSGAFLFDPMIVGDNEVMINKAMQDLKRTDAVIRTAPGMLGSGRDFIKPVPRAPFAGELYQEIERMVGYFDALSGQTATLDGMRESAHDTGVLFARRAVQSEIALATLTKMLESHQRDKFEAWMLYAKHLYSGAYREIGVEGKTQSLNVREYTDSGEVVVNNDLSQLPRHKVIITPSKDGLTVREIDRARNLELLQYVQSPIKRVIIEQNALETLDSANKEKEELRKYNDLEIAHAMAKMEAELYSLKAQAVQAKMQVEQMGMQNQQMGLQNEQMAMQNGQMAQEQQMAVEAPQEQMTEEAPVE